ncbi:MAG: hypothetical protein CM15mP103_12500 [Gammaproteobacteria bacterium]|nr:MAG: hypothetical protein CM15mP103_12500 [Gammaproteobacteria bacterium]
MPGQVGRFLALTSSHINATDALFCGLGTHFLANEQKTDLLASLTRRHGLVRRMRTMPLLARCSLSMVAGAEQPDGQLEPHIDTINEWMAGDDLAAIHARVLGWQGDDVWLGRARDGLAHGSPLAATWIFRQLNQTRTRA